MTAEIREIRLKAGLCVDCGTNAALPGKTKCEECLEAGALYARPRPKKVSSGKALDDIAREAETAGLSYGQYVAREYERNSKRSIPDLDMSKHRGITTLQAAMVVDFPSQTRKARSEAIAMRQLIVSSFYKGMQPAEIAKAYGIDPRRIVNILSTIAVDP